MDIKSTHSSRSENVIIPLITPRNFDDFPLLINHLLDGGIKNLLLFGTTGEGNKIELKTKKAIIKQLIPLIGNRAKFFIALLNLSLEDNIDLTNFCHEIGFTAAFLPLKCATNSIEFLKFLKKTNSDFFLYNTPSDPVFDINEDLFRLKRIRGIKDSSGDIEFIQGLIQKYKTDEFKIYYGREHQLERALSLDIDGIVPAIGNLRPDIALMLWEKRDEAAFALFRDLKKQIDAAAPGMYLKGLKKLLEKNDLIHQ